MSVLIKVVGIWRQVRAGLGRLLVQEVGRVDTAGCGHRVELLKDCERSPEDHAVAAFTFEGHSSPSPSNTTLVDATTTGQLRQVSDHSHNARFMVAFRDAADITKVGQSAGRLRNHLMIGNSVRLDLAI
jgi:hypothetical protein